MIFRRETHCPSSNVCETKSTHQKRARARFTGAQGEICQGDISQLFPILGTTRSSVSNSKYPLPPEPMNPKLEGRAWKSYFMTVHRGVSWEVVTGRVTLSRPAQKRQAYAVVSDHWKHLAQAQNGDRPVPGREEPEEAFLACLLTASSLLQVGPKSQEQQTLAL